jgi:hypothetical protein
MPRVIFDETPDHIIGCGIEGSNAGHLISWAARPSSSAQTPPTSG